MSEEKKTQEHDINQKLLDQLADFLEDRGLSEVEWESGGQRVRLARCCQGVVGQGVVGQGVVGPGGEPIIPISKNDYIIESPIVGTVYLSPKPGAPPFITPGSQVKKGQTLMTIEAMKVQNKIEAPCDAVIDQILVVNKEAVEYGTLLVEYTPIDA